MRVDDARLADPSFAAGFSAGVLQSSDLGIQVLVAQLQETVDQMARTLDEMHQGLGKLEDLGAVLREAELGSPYWRKH
jgi:hypothetical protein